MSLKTLAWDVHATKGNQFMSLELSHGEKGAAVAGRGLGGGSLGQALGLPIMSCDFSQVIPHLWSSV